MLLFAKPVHAPDIAQSPYRVPDAEAVRRTALAASAQRGRAVGRRRIALRWLAWFGWRFALPLATGLGLFWLAVAIPRGAEPALPREAFVPLVGERGTDTAAQPLQLRLDDRLSNTPAGAGSARAAPPPLPAAEKSPLNLQPDDWLHSKEP